MEKIQDYVIQRSQDRKDKILNYIMVNTQHRSERLIKKAINIRLKVNNMTMEYAG